MYSLFESLRSILKVQSCTLDNPIYQLHYRATVIFLVAFSILVTARQFIGDPIECMAGPTVPEKMLDTFCWVHTTFSVETAWKKRIGVDVVYPGVENSKGSEYGRVYHTYYQWVCFVLFFQAIGFWAPRFIWKMAEGGLVKNLVLGLNNPLIDRDLRESSLNLLTDYFYGNMNLHHTRFLVYTATEVLNLINVVAQMALMDRFLGGQFTSYGFEVLKFTDWDEGLRYDPMIRIFPRLTKCIFHAFGPGGGVEKVDAMCLLPINVINEKIYIFLWFWFYFLAILSSLALLYRALTLFFPAVRVMALASHCRLSTSRDIGNVLKNGGVGDWFLLDLLAKNMQSAAFRDLILKLNGRFNADRESINELKEKLSLLHRKVSIIEKR